MIREIFNFIFNYNLYSIFFLLLAVFFFWTIFTVKYSKKRMWLCVNILLFAVTVFAAICFTIVMRYHRGVRSASFDLFEKLRKVISEPYARREVFMNALLFFPLGLSFSQIIYRESARKAFKNTVIFASFLSVGLEALQFVFFCGTAELSDLLLNTFGAAVGALPVLIAGRTKTIHSGT